jgi:hypothetical protein
MLSGFTKVIVRITPTLTLLMNVTLRAVLKTGVSVANIIKEML